MSGIGAEPSILACIKFVPDPAQLLVESATGRPDLVNTPYRISTFDENAIEAALSVASATGGRAIAVSICSRVPPREVVLKAAAMGLTSVYLVLDEDEVVNDPLRVAVVLALAAGTIAEREQVAQWDIVLCGEASADEYNQQVGPRLAAELGMSLATYVTSLKCASGKIEVDRSLEGRSETLEFHGPTVVTVGNEINVPRMPTVLQIMGAGKKRTGVLALSDLEGLNVSELKKLPSIEVVNVFAPPSARKRQTVAGESMDEIVNELLRRLAADGEVTL